MNITFIYPPQWTPLSPHLSLCSLVAQLRAHNHNVTIRDLNIEFYNKILTKDFIVGSIEKAFKMEQKVFLELAREATGRSKEELENDISFKIKLAKFSKIKEFKEKRHKETLVIPDLIKDAVSTLKSKEDFYKPDVLIKSLNVIDKALELVSMPYAPSLLQLHDYSNPFMEFSFESIKDHCLDLSTNMFYSLLEGEIKGIIANKPKFVGISINSSSQIVPGLTLAMLLKKSSDIHVSIGGNFFGRVVDSFKNRPEFFDIFCDSIIVKEGEKPIVELADYLDGKIPIEAVSNLLYKKDGEVKVNDYTKPLTLNEIKPLDLEGFPIGEYLCPDIVLSVQSSKGCYWGKCSFCDQDFGQNHNIKNINNLIAELKIFNEKFGISNFEFIDESVSPAYLEELSQKIISENLEISWFMDSRLESAYSPELLKLARQAGLKMILWGLESGSDRIMELINKGIDVSKRLEILRNSSEADIWNFAFIFFGFPSETVEDAQKTIDMICQNTDIIHSYGRSIFTLGKHTKLRENPEIYFITKILENTEEFSPSYVFETSEGMDAKKVSEIANLCTQECNKAYDNPLWMHLRYRELLFLYIAKYGAGIVHNMHIKAG